MAFNETHQEPQKATEKQPLQYSRIYDKQMNKWYEIDPKAFAAYNRWRNNIRDREQYNKRCSCPQSKWWYCDGMCDGCKYTVATQTTVSLDTMITSDDGSQAFLAEAIAAPTQSVSDFITNRMMAQDILNRLNELMPEALTIGSLRLLGMSDEAIAKVIGINRTTFLYRLEAAKKILQQEFGSDFDF